MLPPRSRNLPRGDMARTTVERHIVAAVSLEKLGSTVLILYPAASAAKYDRLHHQLIATVSHGALIDAATLGDLDESKTVSIPLEIEGARGLSRGGDLAGRFHPAPIVVLGNEGVDSVPDEWVKMRIPGYDRGHPLPGEPLDHERIDHRVVPQPEVCALACTHGSSGRKSRRGKVRGGVFQRLHADAPHPAAILEVIEIDGAPSLARFQARVLHAEQLVASQIGRAHV